MHLKYTQEKKMKSPHWMLMFTAIIITVFISSANVLAESTGIKVKNPTYRMDVKHLSGKIVFAGKQTTVTKDRPADFRIARGTAVDIWIVDNNPFLFTYQGKVVTKDSQDYTAFKKFLSILGDAQKKLGFIIKKNRKDTSPNEAVEEAVEELQEIIEKIYEHVNNRSDIIDKTTRSAEEVKKAKAKVDKWNLDQLEDQLTKKYQTFRDLLEQYNLPLIYEVYKTLDQEDEVMKIISNLREFVKIVHQVHSGVKLENTIEIRDTRKQDQMTITIEPNLSFNKLLSKEARKIQLAGKGSLYLNFEREAYVRYAISAGAVYSFVDDPKFEVKEDAEGNRTITKSSDDYKEFSGAVMLNIIPERLFESNFEPFLQIGASADGDNIGLLLGAGFSVFSFPN